MPRFASIRPMARSTRSAWIGVTCEKCWQRVMPTTRSLRTSAFGISRTREWARSTAPSTSSFCVEERLCSAFEHFELGQLAATAQTCGLRWREHDASWRLDELAMHRRWKPVAMVADAIKDCSKRGVSFSIPFCAAEQSLIAAEKTGRRARAIELDRSTSMWRLGAGSSTQARLRSSLCGVTLLMKFPRLGSETLLLKAFSRWSAHARTLSACADRQLQISGQS